MALAFDTAFCQLVGVPLPIVQAPIGGLATPEVAAAASEAGGLGMLALTWKEPDEIDAIVAQMAGLTDRPFGVNLILRTEQEERLKRCLDAGVRIVSFFWGDPVAVRSRSPTMPGRSSCTPSAAPRRLVASSTLASISWSPRAGRPAVTSGATSRRWRSCRAVVDAVGATTPVVAAGGIGDGRGSPPCLMLGASAGLARHPLRRRRPRSRRIHATSELLVEATETSTLPRHCLRCRLGRRSRIARCATARSTRGRRAGRPPSGSRPGEDEPLATDGAGDPVPCDTSRSSPRAELDGDIDALSFVGRPERRPRPRQLKPVHDIVIDDRRPRPRPPSRPRWRRSARSEIAAGREPSRACSAAPRAAVPRRSAGGR